MKVAIPIENDNLKMFDNAGHSPYFGVFTITGSGMFKSTNLEDVRKNPRDDIDHECNHDHGHACDHDENDAVHIAKHDLLANAIKDCDYIIVKRACKNTMLGLQKAGVKVKKYNGSDLDAKAVLAQMSKELS